MADSLAGVAPVELPEVLGVGARVDVRSRYVGSWAQGFEVVEMVNGGYRVRRTSDGSVLNGLFVKDEIRVERGRHGRWW